MSAPRLQPRPHQGVAGQDLDHLEVGARLPLARPPHGPPSAPPPVPPQGGVDRAAARVQGSLDQRQVLAHHLPAADLCRERPCARPRSGRRSSGPRCPCRGGGRSRAASPLPRPRARRAGRPGSRRCGRAPGGRPGRRACRRRARASSAWMTKSGSLTPGSPARRPRAPGENTPATIARSARLKVGQSGRSMKSVTAPSRTRSARFPSAPPTSRLAATQSAVPFDAREARKTRRASRPTSIAPISSAETSPASPKATPRFRVFWKARNGSTSSRSPRATSEAATALLP